METFEHNRKIIRKYIKFIKNDEKYAKGNRKEDDGYEFNVYSIFLTYLIVIHNFLLIEEKFQKEVKLCGKEINKYLKLKDTTDFDYILNLTKELYDSSHKVRFGTETLDSIESVRLFRGKLSKNNIDIYNKVYFKLDV